jgi:hypothetical protein
MPERKPYSAPQLVRVELNHEQAILSVCTVTAMTVMAGSGMNCRLQNLCKKATTAGDSAARPS